MASADPKPVDQTTSPRPRAWSAIRAKLDRLLHNADNRAMDPYRLEVASIIETLDGVNRDVEGLRGRGLRGDMHRG